MSETEKKYGEGVEDLFIRMRSKNIKYRRKLKWQFILMCFMYCFIIVYKNEFMQACIKYYHTPLRSIDEPD